MKTLVSQSIDDPVVSMQSKIEKLERRLEETNTVLAHLAASNLDLNRDMATIYKALSEILNPPDDGSFNMLGFSFPDDPDDDLLN